MRRTKLRTSRRPSSQRLSEKNDLAAARPERGRFRSFLLTSLKHFLAWDRARAEKRGGGRSVLPIDFGTAEERYRAEPSHDLTPEKIFERRGALVLLECFAFWTVAFHLLGSSL
jgi:RNA polymerase sigma-70 factor (ECF subfamily)